MYGFEKLGLGLLIKLLLPRVRRHRASKPQGSYERVLPWQVTMDQLYAPLFPTPTIGMKWAC